MGEFKKHMPSSGWRFRAISSVKSVWKYLDHPVRPSSGAFVDECRKIWIRFSSAVWRGSSELQGRKRFDARVLPRSIETGGVA